MAKLNETIHQSVRLRIMASLVTLNPTDQVDFMHLVDLLDVTAGNLGAHLRKLEEAGYIAIQKTFVGRRPRTYVAATPEGREVYKEHITALESIIKEK